MIYLNVNEVTNFLQTKKGYDTYQIDYLFSIVVCNLVKEQGSFISKDELEEGIGWYSAQEVISYVEEFEWCKDTKKFIPYQMEW